MKKLFALLAALVLVACGREPTPVETVAETEPTGEAPAFDVRVDRFADVEVLRFEVPGFDELSLQEKKLVYYLSMAAMAGRDIIYDQNYEHNLRIRKLLAAVVGTYSGDRDAEDFLKFLDYAKRVWYSKGIHHFGSSDKMLPEFTPEELARLVASSNVEALPLDEGQAVDELLAMLQAPIFDPDTAAKKVTLDPDVDQVVNSATNYYRDVTAAEVAGQLQRPIQRLGGGGQIATSFLGTGQCDVGACFIWNVSD